MSEARPVAGGRRAAAETAPLGLERIRVWGRRHRRTLLAYTILTPMAIYFFVFVWLPLLFLFMLSFTEWNIVQWPPTFVGLSNYKEAVSDSYYRRVMLNTVVLGTSVLAINLLVGFSTALLLNQKLAGRGIFRTIWYLPVIISGAVMAQMMVIFLHPSESGVVNIILRAVFGLKKPMLWPRDVTWMPIWVVVFTSWRGVGWVVTFFLAGLQSIDPVLYEAARIDGANSRQLLWNITIPLMAPIIIFATVTGLIGGLQMWEAPLVMTGGGPKNATNTLVFSMYRDAFSNLRVGMGTAEAAILLLVLTIGISFQFRFYRRNYLGEG
ncbi:MAG: sugar ABC transporter permease [Chloroflexi bacterium]|nr:sugar ABC transporter permease [Chloroflexota bacterium]